MGGIRGKSAKRRAKMALNTKTFDRISGRFYDEKVVMPSAKVSQEAMLSAPKSFKRFLAAKRAIEVREKRSRGPKVEAEDDDAQPSDNEPPAATTTMMRTMMRTRVKMKLTTTMMLTQRSRK
jgi:hypothetical protein